MWWGHVVWGSSLLRSSFQPAPVAGIYSFLRPFAPNSASKAFFREAADRGIPARAAPVFTRNCKIAARARAAAGQMVAQHGH
jgi:hypothetical protein